MENKKILGQFMDSNIFVLIKDNSALIIDAGAKIEDVKNAVGNAKVQSVLLTHGHFDHCYYANDYAKEFNCPIYMHKAGKEIASDPQKNYGETFYIDNFDNFKLFDKDFKLNLSPFDVDVITTAGHSPCSVCYKIENLLFAGDTLFSNGIGRIDLIGSDKNDMINSLDKLSRVEFETAFSGHGDDSDYARQKRNIALFKRFLSR